MPDWVRDYVMIHELMHLRRLDHSPAYWRLVAAACPAVSRGPSVASRCTGPNCANLWVKPMHRPEGPIT